MYIYPMINALKISIMKLKEELLWTIPVDEEDDLFAIFEGLDEDNRCNLAELNES